MITSKKNFYRSGNDPKYFVGQRLMIEYKSLSGNKHKCACEVISVSATANCGMLYKEFGYTVKIINVPASVVGGDKMIGEIYHDVYESCLYER